VRRRKDGPVDGETTAATEPEAAGERAPREETAEPAAPSEATGLEPAPPAAPEVEALRRERDELKEQLLRKRADFENFRKRVERDRDQAGLEAIATALRGIVPSLDNLERALAAEGDEAALREGVVLTQRELQAALEKQGVVIHDPKGQPFDPRTHQALMHEHVPGAEEGTVVEVLRKGYSFKDRLLRPALVKVAKDEDDSDDAGTEEIH
jgi:molecular chaperone GrpE